MKKTVLFCSTVCCILFLSSCFNDRSYSYHEYGLDRPVKSVEVKTYKANSKFGEVVKDDITETYSVEFNSVGNALKHTDFNANGDIASVLKCRYDDNDNLVENSVYDSEGDLMIRLVNDYEGNKVVKSTTVLTYMESVYITDFKYNGDYVEEETCYIDGELSSKLKYTRNDKSGREWIRYSADGEEESRGVMELNKDGKITKYSIGDDKVCEMVWNEKKLPCYLRRAELYNNTMFSFDLEEDREFYVEYEYDKKGNWIKQIVFEGENKIPVSISERVIEY